MAKFAFPLLVCLCIVVCVIAVGFAGSVIVTDRAGVVATAEIGDSWGRTQKLSKLGPWHVLLGPQLEGSVRILCKDGGVDEAGYVTTHFHLRLNIERGGACSIASVKRGPF